MQKISVIGTGYVGLVTGACLAEFGNVVICVDNDFEKIEELKKGQIPIFEPELEDTIKKNVYSKRLFFSTDIKSSIVKSDVIFIAVSTPSLDDGTCDIKNVLQVAEDIGLHMNSYKVIINKSTVPMGTGERIKNIISDTLMRKNKKYLFDVVSNPEFLREGSAVYDFTHPDRIVLGFEKSMVREILKDIYKNIYVKGIPIIETNVETAEMIKYASNAFLAMKITFINEIAELCEKVGANVKDVALAMGKDPRIGPYFLKPGPGYGGSCFPKDTKALVKMGKDFDAPITLIEQTIIANEIQKQKVVKKIKNEIGLLEGKAITILGITFKANTDDLREAPSLAIIEQLVMEGANIKVYDP
ncbi:MAG: UDP-glucose/GDP-mannose dehydrogenase family protein, partial [Lutispora sp.]